MCLIHACFKHQEMEVEEEQKKIQYHQERLQTLSNLGKGKRVRKQIQYFDQMEENSDGESSKRKKR